jgi:hypothetical protein
MEWCAGPHGEKVGMARDAVLGSYAGIVASGRCAEREERRMALRWLVRTSKTE